MTSWPTLHDQELVVRPLAVDDAPALRAILATPKVWRWWQLDQPDWPLDPSDDDVRFTIVVDGEVAGFMQFAEETDPQYRHASIDIFLDPRLEGRGLGTRAVRLLARWLLDERGHHRLTIGPATANAAAIRCYEKVGFRRVGVMRRYEKNLATGTWRDGLLMDLLPEDLTH